MAKYKPNRNEKPRQTEITPLGEAIENMLSSYNLQDKFDETYVAANWDQIVGIQIAKRTTQVYIRDRKLFLEVNSAPLKNELIMARSKLIEVINKEKSLVDDIVFL